MLAATIAAGRRGKGPAPRPADFMPFMPKATGDRTTPEAAFPLLMAWAQRGKGGKGSG